MLTFKSKAITAAIVACSLLSACDDKKSGDSVSIIIGTANPLTGDFAHWGKDAANGVKLAVNEANAKNLEWEGKKVVFSLLSEDDQGDPKTAAQVADRFVDKGVNVVVGHLTTGPSMVASKTYNQNNIPEIVYSVTGPNFTKQGYNSVFRVISNDNQQGIALAKYTVDKLGFKNFAIVHDKTAYGQGLAEAFSKAAIELGATLVDTQFTTNSATEFGALVTALKQKSPQIVFYGGMDAQAAPLVREMRRQGLKAVFMGADGVKTDQFVTLAQENANGVYASTTGAPKEEMPGYADFEKAYQEAYKQDVVAYAPYAYDATNIMLKAIEEAKSIEPDKFIPIVKAMTHNGVTGKISFDDSGDIKDGIVTLYEYKDGNWHIVK